MYPFLFQGSSRLGIENHFDIFCFFACSFEAFASIVLNMRILSVGIRFASHVHFETFAEILNYRS